MNANERILRERLNDNVMSAGSWIKTQRLPDVAEDIVYPHLGRLVRRVSYAFEIPP